MKNLSQTSIVIIIAVAIMFLAFLIYAIVKGGY
jgi:hypothetical protein